MAYQKQSQSPEPSSDAATTAKTETKTDAPEFTPEQFSFQAQEGYKQAELPHKLEFKPLAKKWQFRWFGYLEGLSMTGKPETAYFKIVRKGDGYEGFPFSQMFSDSAWDGSGLIARNPSRDPNTGGIIYEQVLCVRPMAAWEANQQAIAKATKDRLGPNKQLNAIDSHVKNITESSDLSVLNSELKTEAESGRW